MVESEPVRLNTGETALYVAEIADIDYTTDELQAYINGGRFEVVRFVAPCVRDQRRTYSLSVAYHTSGTDPVGVLGAHLAVMVSAEEFEADLVGPDVAICWDCYNDSGGDVHAEAMRLAAEKWVPTPPMIVVGGKEFKRTPPEKFWDAVRDTGGDGYDTMEAAEKRNWLAVSSWGRLGWDFLEWPYYVAYVRNTPDGFEFATACEGDIDWYVFPTQAQRIEHMDRLAFWQWQAKQETWVRGIHPDAIPDRLKGMFSWERLDSEKDLEQQD